MEVVPSVERAAGTPIRSATRATADSPSCCIIRVNPVGAKAIGRAAGWPRIEVEVSVSETSRRIRGANSTRRNTSVDWRRVASVSAPPSV